MSDTTCAFCGAHQRSTHDNCTTCGAPLELRAQELHRQYLDAKLGRVVRAWLAALRKTAPAASPYETRTQDLERLEYFARLLFAPDKHYAEPVIYTPPSPARLFVSFMTELREAWRLGVLITDLLEALKNERLDLDIAATRARGETTRVPK